jgi:GYF domain 2
MNYLISREGAEYGPYTLADLQRYVASGNVLLTDLARSEGMTDWVPVSQVIGNIPVPALPRLSAGPAVAREGKRLVVPRGATLPHVCVKCGQTADAPDWQKNFCWCNPLFALLVLVGCIGIIAYAIVYYSTRKQMQLSVPLCEQHSKARRKNTLIGWALIGASPLFLICAVSDKSEIILLGVLGFIALLIAGAVVLNQAQPLRPRKIDDAQGTFTGAGEPFLRMVENQAVQAASAGY